NERLEAINEVGMLLSSNLQAEDPYDLAAAAIAGEFKLEMAAIGIVGARGLELSAVAPETEAAMGKELIARAGAARAMETALLQFEVEPTGDRLCWAPIRDRQGNQGLLREKALGRSLFDVFDQQQREDIESELRPVFDRGESLVFERDSTADGELRHFRIRKVPMRLEPGEVTHVLTIGEDITD